MYPQARCSVSERFPIARRSATLDGSVQVRVRSYRHVSDHPHRFATRGVELFTSATTDIHNCRINADEPINAILLDMQSAAQSRNRPLFSVALMRRYQSMRVKTLAIRTIMRTRTPFRLVT